MNKEDFESILRKHEAWLRGSKHGTRACFKNEEIPADLLSDRTFVNVRFEGIYFTGNIRKAQFIECDIDDCVIRSLCNVSMTFVSCDLYKLTVPRLSSGVVIM